jgi:hypothetical protein
LSTRPVNLCFSTTTGRGLFAEGPKPSAKAQKPSAKALPRVALDKELSGNFESAKRVFTEGLLSGSKEK